MGLLVSAGSEEFRVLIEAGSGRLEHDQVLLQQAQPADVGGRVVRSSAAYDVPGDCVRNILIF